GTHFRPAPGYVWVVANPEGNRDYRVKEDAGEYEKAAIELVGQGKLEPGKMAYEKALYLRPHDFTISIDFARALWKSRDYRSAADAYRQALTDDSYANADADEIAATHDLLAVSLEKLGQNQEADTHFLQAIAIASNEHVMHSMYGNYLA